MVVAELTKSTWRACKDVTKGYSKTQQKARNATKNDPSLPTTRELNELADLSFNETDFIEIMEALDKRLNDKGKLWRHVYKALVVLEYLLLWGSDNVIRYCENNLYEIKTLREFQYIDDNESDCGLNVRQKAKDVTNLVLNPTALRSKRQRAGLRSGYNPRSSRELDDSNSAPRARASRPRNGARDRDADMQRALEESRRSADRKRTTSEEEDLQRAIRLSKEDEERRKQATSSAEMTLLDTRADSAPKDAPLIDLADVQITPSVPLQMQYTQYQPVQPQYTIQPQFTQLQPQYTQFSAPYSFSSPYSQQMSNDAMQAEYMRQQLEWSAQQQQAAQQQELWRQQQLAQMQQQQMQQQQSPPPIQPQPTNIGSNNPFAASSSPSPSLSSTATSSSRMSPATPFSTRSLSRTSDTKHSQLAGIFANREDDGVDTFGNYGALRFGPTSTGRLAAQRTGVTPDNNPFHYQRPTSV